MNEKVNVLMVGSNLNVKGGMTTVVESFLSEKSMKDINLTYIATHSHKGKYYNIFYFFVKLIIVTYYLTFKRIDILHMHMSERGSFKRKYILFKIAKRLGKKVITHTHGAEFKDYYLNGSIKNKTRIKELLKGSDKVITLGIEWDKTIREIEPTTDTVVLVNAVNIPVFEKKISESKLKILFLAVLIERKGILDLINASVNIIKVMKEENKEVEFVIAGDGELMEAAKKLTRDLNVEKSFNFLGWIDNRMKKNVLEEADLFVLPSYNEGLPVSILEAMSYGIPIVSTDVGSINEAVKEGNGKLITPGNIEVLSKAIIEILKDPHFKEMGIISREMAIEKFSTEIYFRKIEGLYKGI